MADDQQFDPFSGGILTPQSLQLQRLAMQMKAMQQAQMNGQQNAGQAFGSQSLGLSAGQLIGDAINSRAGSGSGNALDRIANQNAGVLNDTVNAPSSGGSDGSTDSSSNDPFASQIMRWQAAAQLFSKNGNYSAAQAAQDKANILVDARAKLQETQGATAKSAADVGLDKARSANQLADSKSKTIEIPIDNEGNIKTMGFNPQTGQYDILLGVGKKTPQTSVTLLTQQDKVPLYQAVAKELGEAQPKALATQQNINRIDAAGNLLKQGIIAGTAANSREELANVMATLGFSNGDSLARTQAFLAQTRQLAIGLGKGAFTRITNWEAQLLQGISAGDNTVALPALKGILSTLRDGQVQQLNQFNNRRDQLSKDKNIGDTVGSLYPRIDIPDDPNAGQSGPMGVNETRTVGGFKVTRTK